MRKRGFWNISAMLAALSLVLALAGCGGSGSPASGNDIPWSITSNDPARTTALSISIRPPSDVPGLVLSLDNIRVTDGSGSVRPYHLQVTDMATRGSRQYGRAWHLCVDLVRPGTIYISIACSRHDIESGTIPVSVYAFRGDMATVSAGSHHSMAIGKDGSLWAWGGNWVGQLGDGTTTQRSSPIQIQPGTTWSSVSPGSYHIVAIGAGGTLWAWGSNSSGQLGIGLGRRRLEGGAFTFGGPFESTYPIRL